MGLLVAAVSLRIVVVHTHFNIYIPTNSALWCLVLELGELNSTNTFTILADKERVREEYIQPIDDGGATDVLDEAPDCVSAEARVDQGKSYRTMVTRYVNALTGANDVCAQQMATVSLGLPLEFTSHRCVQLHTYDLWAAASKVLQINGRAQNRGVVAQAMSNDVGEHGCEGAGEETKDHGGEDRTRGCGEAGGRLNQEASGGTREGCGENGSGGCNTLCTDGKGGTVIMAPFQDYLFRCGVDGGTLAGVSYVQFALGYYKKRTPRKTVNARYFPLCAPHAQAGSFCLFERVSTEDRVFVFVGPTARPHDPERWACFVLLFFKPWSFPAGVAGLLEKSGGESFSTWVDALDAWEFSTRRRLDERWYLDVGGAARHPFLDNVERMFDGEDRAAEMARDRQRQSLEDVMDLRSFAGDTGDDNCGGGSSGDTSYLQTAGVYGAQRYTKSSGRGRPLRHRLDELAIEKRVKHMQARLGTVSALSSLPVRPSDALAGFPSETAQLSGLYDASVSGIITSRATSSVIPSDLASAWTSSIRHLAGNVNTLAQTAALGFGNGDPDDEAGGVRQTSTPPYSYSVKDIVPCVDIPATECLPPCCLIPRGGVGVPQDGAAQMNQHPGGNNSLLGPSLIEVIVSRGHNPKQALATFDIGSNVNSRLRGGAYSADNGLILLGEPGMGKSHVAQGVMEWLTLNGNRPCFTGGSWTGKGVFCCGLFVRDIV